jgi:hypothetical protein
MRTNPVTAIKPVKVAPFPTLPFDEIQMARILDACERYPITGIYTHGHRQRMKALTLLLRYSGLRSRDAVTCTRERFVESKLFLYQAKTSTPVYCPIPPIVVDAPNEMRGPNPKFWPGNGNPKTAVPMLSARSEGFSKWRKLRGTQTCSAIRLPWSC